MSPRVYSQGNNTDLRYLENQWILFKFKMSSKQQKAKLNNLTRYATQILFNHPNNPDYLIWEAKVYILAVEISGKIKSIGYAKHARNSLKEALKYSSGTKNGKIYSNLGYLYMISPELSLAIKSKSKEERFLKGGIKENKNGVESNFYYGLYLLRKEHNEKLATKYFKIALNSNESDFQYENLILFKQEIKKIMDLYNKK